MLRNIEMIAVWKQTLKKLNWALAWRLCWARGRRPACVIQERGWPFLPFLLICFDFILFSSDAAPLSAPAFSFCFPLLNATLRESSGSTEETENTMMRALQVINEHSQLRADTNSDDVAIDEVQTNDFIAFSLWWLLCAQSEFQTS